MAADDTQHRLCLTSMNPSIELLTKPKPKVVYPESDGQPMAENTLQFRYIVMIEGGLEALYRQDPNVFVAGDLFWYPVEGDNTIRQAPDTLVVFGRPKGDRGSYRQWEEDNVAPQVVFEVLSPGNRFGEMYRKFQFYEQYGVEEYYVYDPDRGTLEGWLRGEGKLQEITALQGWISPRLHVQLRADRRRTAPVRSGRQEVRHVYGTGGTERSGATTSRAGTATGRAGTATGRARTAAGRAGKATGRARTATGRASGRPVASAGGGT